MLSDCIEWNIEDRKKNMINEHTCACLQTWAKQRKNYCRALKWNIKKKETDLKSQSPCIYSSHILLVLHLWTDVCSWTRVRSPRGCFGVEWTELQLLVKIRPHAAESPNIRMNQCKHKEGSTSSSAGVMVTAVIIGLGSRFSEVGRYSLMFADFDMIWSLVKIDF